MALRAIPVDYLDTIAVIVHPDDPLEWLFSAASGVSTGLNPTESSIRVVFCENASEGMSNSIRCGLKSLLDERVDLEAVIVMLADQPFITKELIEKLIYLIRSKPELDFVASSLAGEADTEQSAILMPPAILSRSMFQSLLQLEGDSGARKLFGMPEFNGSSIVVSDRTSLMDIDTPLDLQQAEKRVRNTLIG